MIIYLRYPQVSIFAIFLLIIFQTCDSPNQNKLETVVLQNITTIDPVEGLKSAQNIYIKEGKISKVESYSENLESSHYEVIDGSGKYLIPGLWDAHVHFAYMENLAPRMLDLFLVYGVTSVRDTGGKIGFVKEWKDKSLANPTTAPRVMIAGPLLDGLPNVYDGSDPSKPPLSVGLGSDEQIKSKISALIQEDVDLLKAYEMLTPAQFALITNLARENGLKVTGHVPLSMDVVSASEAGLNSIEHLRNIELSCASNHVELLESRKKLLFDGRSDPGGILRTRIHRAQRQNAVENYNQDQADIVLAALKKNDTWQIPTLALNLGGVNRPFVRTDFQASFQYLPDSVETMWKERAESFMLNPPSQFDLTYAEWKKKMVNQMHQKGITIMAGTDCPIGSLTPGLSLHEELFELVESGLSPLDAINSATHLPAKYFEMENELGSIKVGQWADLLILTKNPLDDIRNTTTIDAVIKQGNIIDQEEILALKEKLNSQ